MLLGIRWRSLRLKIIAWSFVPTVIILVAVALFGFNAYQQVTETLVIARNQELARRIAGQLTGELEEYTSDLTAVARTADIFGNNPPTQRSALRQASNRLAVFDAGVLILDSHGIVVAAEPARPDILGQDWSNRAYFVQMVHSPGSLFSDIVNDGPDHARVVVAAVPITGGHGEFVGMLAGMFHLGAPSVSSFYATIVKLRIGADDNAFLNAYLVDHNGQVIYHTDADRIGDDFSGQEPVQQALSGRANALRTRDFAGREIVASFAPVPGPAWGLVTEVSWDVLLSASQGYQRFLLLLLGLGVVIPAIVVAIGVRRITRPLNELIVAARQVASGDFGQAVVALTGDEVQELAKQFNLMSARLAESYTRLQEREERFSLAMQGANDGLWDWDLKTNRVYYSPRWKGMLGYAEDEIEPHFSAWDRLVHPDDKQPAVKVIEAFRAGQTDKYEIEFRMRHKDGHYVNVLSRAFGVREKPDEPIVRLVGTHIDITERKRAEEEIRRQNEYLAALHETTLGVMGHLDIQELLEAMVERAVKLVGASEGWAHLVTPDKQEIESVVETGKYRKYVGLRLKQGEGLSGRIWQSGQSVALENYHAWLGRSSHFDDAQIGPAIGVPLKFGSEVVGVIGLTRTPPATLFSQEEIDLMSRLAHLASIALENARLHTSLQDELVERTRAQEALQERLDFEKLITTISTNFVNLEPDKIDTGIRQALRAIGEFTLVDHSYVSLLSEDKAWTCCAHEWCAEGVEPQTCNPEDVMMGVLPWLDEKIKRLEVVYVPRVADLAPEASTAKAQFQSQGIQSLIAIPMTYRGGAVGFLGLDSVRTEKIWAEQSIALLKIAGEIFANALQHKRAQGALQRSEARFRAVFEGAAIGMAISDMNGRLLKVNPALERMLGYTEDELSRMAISDYSHPDDVKIQQALDDETVAGKRDRYQIEKRYIRKGGQPIMWGRMSHSVARDEKGELLFYIGMVEDITEQKQAQQALQAAYQTLERRVEERTHELATLNAIAAVASRSLDLTEIMSDALDKTMQAVGMEGGSAYRLDETGETLILIAHRGLSQEFAERTGRLPLQLALAGQKVRQDQPLVWPITDYPEGQVKEWLQGEGLQLVIGVPLMIKGRLLGGLALSTRNPRCLAPEESSLLMAIGQQIGIALENARLYKAEQDRREEAERGRQVAEGMREILAVLNSKQSFDETLNYIVKHACRLMGSDAAAIFRLQAKNGPLKIQSACGLDADFVNSIQLPVDASSTGRTVLERRPLAVPDTIANLALLEREDRVPPYLKQASFRQFVQQYHAMLSVPLIVKDEDYGAITLYYRHAREFSEEEIRLALSVAHQAALAIESARLREQAEQAAAMAERNRLARELHDSVTQSLYSVTLYAEAAARLLTAGQHRDAADHLRELRDTAQEALREMRLLIFELRPLALERSGLIAALQTRLEAVEGRGGMQTELQVEGAQVLEHLPFFMQEELYHIAQEALNNVLKHAKAQRVSVDLRSDESILCLRIGDDGVGFTPAVVQDGGGLGLRGMRERAQRIGGTLQIDSVPGQGTRVTLQVPLNSKS